MKKSIIAFLFLIIPACFAIACARINPGRTSETGETTQATTTASTTSSPATSASVTPTNGSTSTQAGPADLSTIGLTIQATDLGLSQISPSYFYWSPQGQYIVFMGLAQDSQTGSQAQASWNVYLFRPSDQSVTKIIDGEHNVDYSMLTPHWSLDENLIAFSFFSFTSEEYPIYLYRLNTKTLEELPVHGFEASFSPDNSRVALTGMDETIVIYNLANRSIDDLGGQVQGLSPIWFSDNKRIIFCQRTSTVQTDLGPAYLRRIGILDTTNPGSVIRLGSETAIHHMTRIIPDQMVNIQGGWDDGYFAQVLDLKTNQIMSFAEDETVVLPFRRSKDELEFLVHSSSAGTMLLDSSHQKIGTYALPVNPLPCFAVLPDHRLVYFLVSGQETSVMLSYINENRSAQAAFLAGPSEVYLSPAGDRYAFIWARSTKLLLISRSAFLPD